jgi:hypothetical protein
MLCTQAYLLHTGLIFEKVAWQEIVN